MHWDYSCQGNIGHGMIATEGKEMLWEVVPESKDHQVFPDHAVLSFAHQQVSADVQHMTLFPSTTWDNCLN